ncbi:hypothetical protein ANI_1_876074 [Paecilomyces variotii No. 5]|uniref:Nucleolar 27S pre-rRNA processing Urb2/Npa2 C-terminal domain-containing protein n=1 Tax=Byssochlamys spectabilis (strain No. 5 / NBRC 109023) TaxID=1356009 RepID=V5GBY0_BYSSN|nr:hypothetical protein ANI_1_876074 [Paecilomyces variotii No. 5]
MAPVVERSRSSQEALLQLEKGTGSPVTQLEEAARIIGIDLSLCSSHPEVNREVSVHEHAAPKEEWVLRWLLKKLKAGNAYRVEPCSFLLFRQLIDRIPLKTLAATLNDYKFLPVLGDVFGDLENGVLSTATEVSHDALHSGSESSHTISGSPSREDGDKKGKKRKRASDYGDAMDVDEPQPSHKSYLLAFIRTLDTLYCLINLANKVQTTDDIATAHLKHALREQPEAVAKILGRSFKIGAVATEEYSRANLNTELRHIFYVLSSTLDLWDLRSSRLDDAESNSSNECFASYCFPQALRLQLAARSASIDCDERSQMLHGIERLIALHVVLPARAFFFSKGGSGIDYSSGEPDWSPVQPVSDALRPYLREKELQKGSSPKGTVERKTIGESQITKTSSWTTAELLPTFLDIAIRSVPRDTFRRQTHEVPWLETLFVAIAELTFSTVKEDNNPDVISTFVPILEQLFRVILERKVQLSLHTLLTHAAYTGLLKDDLQMIKWDLTALLMKLGVDIFLPNSGLDDSSRLLEALLAKVTSYWTRGVPLKEETYEVIKTGVVIPLLRGFATARALPTFVQLWHEQLVAVESARSKAGGFTGISVWEDDDVASAYSDVLRTSLTPAQVFSQVQTAVIEIKAENGKVADTPTSFARLIIVEADLKNILQSEDSTEKKDALGSLVETVIRTLSSKQDLHWRWRLWRFAANVFGDSSKSADLGLTDSGNELVERAAKVILRLHKKPEKRSTDYMEILEAYRFSVVISEQDTESRCMRQLEEICENMSSFLKTISTGPDDALVDESWNGRVETVNSPAALATGYLVTLLRTTEVWHKLKSDIRRSLFNEMFALSAAQWKMASETSLDSPSPQTRFLQVWAGLASHAYLLNAPYLASDLVAVLTDRLKNDTSMRCIVVHSLQRIPPLLISRHQRGVLLDSLQDIILQASSPLEICAEMLSLMAKLAELSKSPASLTSDWEVVWKIAKAVSLRGTDTDMHVLRSFRSLHRAVVAKFLVSAEEDRQKMFKKTYRKISSAISKLESIDYNSLSEFLVRISISQLLENRERVPDVVDEEELTTYRLKLFKLLVSELSSFRDRLRRGDTEDRISLMKVLDALEDYEDLARNSKKVEKYLASIEESMTENEDHTSLKTLVRRRILASRDYERDISPLVQSAPVFTIQQLYGEEQKLFVHETVSRFRSMSTEDLVAAVQSIRAAGFIGGDASYRLLLAAVAVSAFPPVEEKASDLSQELSALCTAVTESLSQCSSIEHFSLACECLDVLLRTHPRSITQWNVDNILASISACASSSGPEISPEHAGTVYTRLCRLLGVLLGLYRQKLGGRFHLVVPIMQRLLNCLFPPNKRRMRSTRQKVMHSHPPWLAPLDASHAVHYTRLLTSLCDPTVSAVSRPAPSGPGHEALTDQTKKAKRVAGQYLQYVIMEYAECSLRGALKPEVKAAVTPGLYAALDVMSRDTMRALNAGLDVSGRAVFKGLYDDYVKFGKWNKG